MEKTKGRWTDLMAKTKERLHDEAFCHRHRRQDKDFTRERLLTFPVVMLLLLQKTTRSIQRHVHSFMRELWPETGVGNVTPGGWTQARAKLRHTAFVELNEQILLPEFYSVNQAQHCQRWRGFRLLGIDGSTLRLPPHPEIAREFGVHRGANQRGETGRDYTVARFSVLYDLLNNLGWGVELAPQTTSELDMVQRQLKCVNPNDVLIWDRGLTGFLLLAQTRAHGAHFIARCSHRSFFTAQEMFRRNRAGDSQRVKLLAAPAQRPELRALNLPQEMEVRFISVRLPNGELEVLVSSLLDETRYPTGEFLEVYHWRWNHETYHQMLKSRLDLENWTGQTLEAVLQDVQAAVFVSNLESLLSQEVQEELTQGDAQRQYPLQVNRSVSYHALKEHLLALLYSQTPIENAIKEIQTWMRRNPVCVRKRKTPRPPPSFPRSYNYQRNIKKSVF
jgi:hypothetical protein